MSKANQTAARLADRIDAMVRELDALRDDRSGILTPDEREAAHRAADELLPALDRLRGRRLE